MSLKVAVIVPAYNEREVIDDCLASLTRQSYSNLTCLIVDDQSTDDTASRIQEWQKRFPQLIQFRTYGKVGPGLARNRAASEAEAELLAFMDADCIATPTWVEELARTFEKFPEAQSVGGPHLAPPQSNPFQQQVERFFQKTSALTDFYKTTHREIRPVLHNPLCNVAYRRTAFLKLNGFNTNLFPGEDYEMDYRLRKSGALILFNPHALVFHHRPETLEQFRKVMKNYGRAQGQIVRLHGPHRLLHLLGILALPFLPIAWLVSKFSFGGSSLQIFLSASRWLLGFWHGLLRSL